MLHRSLGGQEYREVPKKRLVWDLELVVGIANSFGKLSVHQMLPVLHLRLIQKPGSVFPLICYEF